MKSCAFVLLLLSRCLSEGQTQSHNQILNEDYQEDILLILRELAELRAELRNTTAELRNATAELKNVETRLAVSESQVGQLQEKLGQQIQLNEAQAKNRSIIETTLLSQVERMMTTEESGRVAFSAYFEDNGGSFGPFNRNTKLIFSNVITNIGNAFSSITGAFTAPVKGVYQFDLHIQGEGSSSTQTAVELLKNEHFAILAFGHQRSSRVTSSNGVSLLLDVGDIITLRLPTKKHIFGDIYRLTTFNGHLLFPM